MFQNTISFKACALTILNDGSLDNNIHCFTADQSCHAGLERLQSLNDIVTGPRAHPFAGISVAVNLNNEAEMESDPDKVISDDSGSDAADVDSREFKIYDAIVAKTSLKIASSSFSIYFAIMSVCLTFES